MLRKKTIYSAINMKICLGFSFSLQYSLLLLQILIYKTELILEKQIVKYTKKKKSVNCPVIL